MPITRAWHGGIALIGRREGELEIGRSMMDSLFSSAESVEAAAPLAARLRPRSLDEIVGHEQLLGLGRP
ncbi:MAG: hypothetical protein ACRDG4_00690, partial [Chloroflexota bacterium]